MKTLFNLRFLLVLATALAAPAAGYATTYTKADNTNSLDQTASWAGGGTPGGSDIAQWSGAYSGGPATGVVTNSLYAIFPAASTPAWAGISVGALTGSSLTQSPIFNNTTSVSNITAATEAVVNGFNLVTITCTASHRFEPGQTITISGVIPVDYNGTFIVAGVPAASQFTYTNAVGALAAGTDFGTASANMYIGGSGAGNGALTIGAAGITVAGGAPGVVVNASAIAFSGNQTWNLAPGTLLRFSGNGSGASAKIASSGADGLITIKGGGIASLNEGSTGFAAFTGSWQVDSGSLLRGLFGFGNAFGTPGNITLSGGTLAVGGMQGDVGGWSWNNAITLNSGTTSFLAEQNVAGTKRYLQLSGALSGSGNLVFIEPLVAATTFTSMDGGFTLCGDASGLSGGTITIGGPVENGVPDRLTYLRVGGTPPTGNGQVGSGTNGSLGSDDVVNNGVLTFTLTGALDVPGQISGTGTLQVGTLTTSTTFIGDAYQNITLNGVNTYTGPTVINAGTLTLAAGASIANSSSISIATDSVNGGAVVNTFDVSQLPSGFTTAPGQTLSLNGGQVNGTLNFATGSTNLVAPGGFGTVGTLNIAGDLNLSGGTNTLTLDINSAANDQIVVNGNLTAAGVTMLQFAPPPTGLNAGAYTLITAYGTVTATPANFNIIGLVAGARPQTFNIAVSGNTVQLVVAGSPGNLTWTGDGSANVWSTATTFSNWYNQVTFANDIFVQGDQVTFDDSGSTAPDINLTGTLTPSSVTFNNYSKNYTLGGDGQIAGATGLTVGGSGWLTINNSNSFTGNVLINGGGIVAITNEAALGEPTNVNSQSLTLDNGSALLVTNTLAFGANTNRGIIIGTGGGTFIVTNGATLTVANVIGDLTGVSVLTKTGDGTLVLAGNNNYGGGTIVQNGAVIYGLGQALGRGNNTLGTSGFFVPPFELDNGLVDINGQFSYQPNFTGGTAATGVPVILYSGTLNFAGVAGAALTFQDSGAIPTGWGSTAAQTLTYSEVNNPGTLTINARFAASGTSASSKRTFTVGDSTATATEVNITAPMGVASLDSTNQDGRNVTIVKNGAGTMQISAANNFPILEVDEGTLRVNDPLALGADRSGSTGASGGTGSPNLVIVTAGTVDLNGFSPAIGGLSDNAATTGLIVNNGASASTLTLGYSMSNTVFDASYSSVIADGTSAVSLNKIGTNTEALAGMNTYSGVTTVNNGALVVNSPGQIGLGNAASTVTVAGGALGGSGMINAPVVVQPGGTLAPGAGAVSTTTLTLTTSLTLGGTNLMNVNKDSATNDLVVLTSGTINYGGTLAVVTNLMVGTTLALGDSFQLFCVPAHTGNFSHVAGSPGAGLAWQFDPASGVLSVVTGSPEPALLTSSVSGNTLSLGWPVGEGWRLEMQTNSLSVGLQTSGWVDVTPGSANSTNITINPTTPAVFYRLVNP